MVQRVLKAMSANTGPNPCTIDDMSKYVDEAIAICLADPQIKFVALFKELQKNHAVQASTQTS